MRLTLALLLWAAALPAAAAEPCFSVRRLVEAKLHREAAFKARQDMTSYVSGPLIPHLYGFYSSWVVPGKRGENLLFTRLALEKGVLSYDVSLGKNDIPMDAYWDVVWKRRDSVALGHSAVYASRSDTEDFRITLRFGAEPDAAKCAVPQGF